MDVVVCTTSPLFPQNSPAVGLLFPRKPGNIFQPGLPRNDSAALGVHGALGGDGGDGGDGSDGSDGGGGKGGRGGGRDGGSAVHTPAFDKVNPL